MEETEDDAFGSLLIGFPLAMGVIYMILAGFLRSYTQPLIILFTVPFGIIGAILGHLALRHSISLFSIFGMVALAGVVVNDAIVLVHRLNVNAKNGIPFPDSLIEAAQRRFRAILLTSMSTVGGLAPLIMEKSLEAQWLIPMAISIAAGVVFATTLTLILIPCLLAILQDLKAIPLGGSFLSPVSLRNNEAFRSPTSTYGKGSLLRYDKLLRMHVQCILHENEEDLLKNERK
jgi:multidrug efflux pump subunit AcrB